MLCILNVCNTAPSAQRALEGIQLQRGCVEVADNTHRSVSNDRVWAGGDCVGTSGTTVEAVADGKTAAWNMHQVLQVRAFFFPLVPLLLLCPYSLSLIRVLHLCIWVCWSAERARIDHSHYAATTSVLHTD